MYRTTLMLAVAAGALAVGPALGAETVPAAEEQEGQRLEVTPSDPAGQEAGGGTGGAQNEDRQPDAGQEATGQEQTGQAGSAGTDEGAAGGEARQPATACRDRLDQLRAEMQGQVAGSGNRAARSLRDAALVLAETGRTEACLAVVDSLEAVLAEGAGDATTAARDVAALQELMAESQPVDRLTVQIRASRLMEGEVVSTDGDDMGEIEDVILSSTDGRRWVLVETGGFWGMGQDYVPIALSRLHMIDDETYAVQIGSDLFDQAPRFDDDAIAGASGWADEADSWWENNAPTAN